jgi:glutamate racemase
MGEGLRVGLFDSGLGGLSVLRSMRACMPLAELIYVADSGHAPYGERDDAFIATRCAHISRFLQSQSVDAIVVACNTATAAAVHHLRAQLPHLPIVGVEPGVKPAVQASARGKVGVLATPGTLASAKFQRLIAHHGHEAHIVLQACPGLAREIEAGELDTPQLRELVSRFSRPLSEAGVDTVVLGCTHYPFVEPLFREYLGPGVALIDTADAVARHTARLLGVSVEPGTAAPPSSGATHLWSSADPAHLQAVAHRWLGLNAPAGALPT